MQYGKVPKYSITISCGTSFYVSYEEVLKHLNIECYRDMESGIDISIGIIEDGVNRSLSHEELVEIDKRYCYAAGYDFEIFYVGESENLGSVIRIPNNESLKGKRLSYMQLRELMNNDVEVYNKIYSVDIAWVKEKLKEVMSMMVYTVEDYEFLTGKKNYQITYAIKQGHLWARFVNKRYLIYESYTDNL